MTTQFKTTEQKAKYQQLADYLENRSEEICKDNQCTEEQHNCESYAYFDYDEETQEYSLADVCTSDYAQKCYASYVFLPFSGNAYDLFAELESNLLEEYF